MQDIEFWIPPLSFVLAGYFLGKLFERFVLNRVSRLARRTSSRFDDILVASLGKNLTLWFVITGVYAATQNLGLEMSEVLFVNRILLIVIAASVTLVVSRLAVGYVNLYAMKARGVLPSTTIFSNLTRLIVLVVGALVVLQTLGISITPILTALGVGGLAVALALQNTLSNLFAGVQIITSGQVRPGDFVRIDSGEEGFVVDVAWRNTTIRQLSNSMVIVPNSYLASTRVINFNQPDEEQAVLVDIGVSYDSNLEQVEQVTAEVALVLMKSVAGGIPDFQPFIRYHSFGESSINFTTILRARQYVDQYLLKHEFIKRLHARFAEERIEIPFPIRTLHLKNSGAGGGHSADPTIERDSSTVAR